MSVELRKGQKVNLEKTGSSMGEIVIDLTWSQSKKKGLFARQPQPIDLDLACMFELTDGNKGIVQALGNRFGSLTSAPYISLDGDDRGNDSDTNKETLRINGSAIKNIRRVLVYTFIYEGAANWRDANGIVTVKCPGSQDIIVRMDEYGSNEGFCAIAMLENFNNETFSVEKVVRFFPGHEACDRAFGWGMQWKPARKD